DEGMRHTEAAIARTQRHPIPHYNLGAALLATGRLREAERQYSIALRRTLDLPNDVQLQLLAGALTDINLVTKYRPEREPEAQRLRGVLVARLLGRDPETMSPARRPVRVEPYVGPTSVEFALPGTRNPFPEGVSSVWSYGDSRGSYPWAAVPELLDHGPLWNDGGGLFRDAPYLKYASPPRCLDPGRYRVELYAGQHLAGE